MFLRVGHALARSKVPLQTEPRHIAFAGDLRGVHQARSPLRFPLRLYLQADPEETPFQVRATANPYERSVLRDLGSEQAPWRPFLPPTPGANRCRLAWSTVHECAMARLHRKIDGLSSLSRGERAAEPGNGNGGAR